MVLHTRGRVGRRQLFSKPHLMYFKWGFFGFRLFEELVSLLWITPLGRVSKIHVFFPHGFVGF